MHFVLIHSDGPNLRIFFLFHFHFPLLHFFSFAGFWCTQAIRISQQCSICAWQIWARCTQHTLTAERSNGMPLFNVFITNRPILISGRYSAAVANKCLRWNFCMHKHRERESRFVVFLLFLRALLFRSGRLMTIRQIEFEVHCWRQTIFDWAMWVTKTGICSWLMHIENTIRPDEWHQNIEIWYKNHFLFGSRPETNREEFTVRLLIGISLR